MEIKKIIYRKEYRINRNILIEDFKSIYFYMPKNGCTSLKTAVHKHVSDTNHEGSIHKYDFPFATFNQLNTNYSDYMKFAIVRNPWNRLASCFKGKIRSANFNSNNYENGVAAILQRYVGMFYGDMPFKEFVEVVCSIPASVANPHFISQLYWLTDYSGELLPNYIGRLENLKPLIEDIYKNSGLSFSNMKHENKSRVNIPYTELYTEDLKEKVREKFAGDIDTFGYEFETDADIEPIGYIDDAFRERLAKSKYLLPILEEKAKQLKGINDK